MISSNPTLLSIYTAKALRTFCFGCISVIFALYLHDRGFDALQIGAILSATLIEDAILTAFVSSYANRIGIKKVLVAFSLVICLSGCIFALVHNPLFILAAAVLGIVSPSGFEGGPFGAIEQSIISESERTDRLAKSYSVYNLLGFAGAALGALIAGCVFPRVQGAAHDSAYLLLFGLYALGGLALAVLYLSLSVRSGRDINACSSTKSERPIPSKVLLFTGLQGLDAFGGGFVPQTLISFWFYEQYHVGPEFTGPVFFLTYVCAALSLSLAPSICKRFGVFNTMVFSHLPCSLTLGLIPFMPSAVVAAVVLVIRSLLSSMDIPARQAYSMLLVPAEHRAQVAGFSSASRSVGQCVAPLLSGLMLADAWTGLPFLFAGACKTTYDTALYLGLKDLPMADSHVKEASQTNPDASNSASIAVMSEGSEEEKVPRDVKV